jgi:hypothetical protein
MKNLSAGQAGERKLSSCTGRRCRLITSCLVTTQEEPVSGAPDVSAIWCRAGTGG